MGCCLGGCVRLLFFTFWRLALAALTGALSFQHAKSGVIRALIALPILLPPAKALGIDMVHFGMVVIFNLVVGIMTPPMGIGLFILAAISKLRIGELVWATIPFHIMLLVALLLLTIFPEITLVLPRLLMN